MFLNEITKCHFIFIFIEACLFFSSILFKFVDEIGRDPWYLGTLLELCIIYMLFTRND